MKEELIPKTRTAIYKTKSNNLQFQSIIKNEIICSKVGKYQDNVIKDNQILIDTLNIGKIVNNRGILQIIEKTSNKELLQENIEIDKLYFNPTITKDDIRKTIMSLNQKLDKILLDAIDNKQIDNNNSLIKFKYRDELYNKIESWFNMYGAFIYQNTNQNQKIDLYDFLSKCNDIYLMYIGNIKIPKISIELDLIQDETPIISHSCHDIFDYIIYQLLLYFIGTEAIISCEICGNLMTVKRNNKHFCSEACIKRNQRKRKKEESRKRAKTINALEGNNDNSTKKR